MQKHRLISTTMTVLMVTVILVIIVTFCTTTQLRAQAEGQEAPSTITSEPVTEEGLVLVTERLGMPMFAGTSSASIAAHGEYVFVLHDETLYQFAVESLKLVNKVTLEEVQRPKKK